MSDSVRDRYLELIDQIVQLTLKGKIRSKEQVYQMLVDGVSSGTGELFERCLGDRIAALQRQTETQTDELQQAKASRSLRSLQTIQGEWERWQQNHQASETLTSAVQQIVTASANDRLNVLLQILDPNRNPPLTLPQWQQLAKQLQQLDQLSDPTASPALSLSVFANGILRGIDDWHRLESHLVGWIYDQSQGQIGFESVGQRGPWALWAKHVQSEVLASFFKTLSLERSPVDWLEQSETQRLGLGEAELVNLAIVLRCLQQGLVTWFDKLVYDSKVGAKLSVSTFLTFAVLWSQLASGFQQTMTAIPSQRQAFVNACFQITLQILRSFTQREYFPLYGGVFASFSGQYLRDALSYLDAPLRQAEGTQEKARILTLLGYSAQTLGDPDRAMTFHQQALSIAQQANDRACEVANLNHLSRVQVSQTSYAEAINYSQRAVILSRQAGDRLGEANALANLGFSEVFQAQQLEQMEPELYESAIGRLQQGLLLSEKLGDRQSQALCLSSLGIAHVVLEQPQKAIAYLESGIPAAQFTGDVYLQGINFSYLAEACDRLQNPQRTIYYGCLGMYLLKQIGSTSWRQASGLLRVLRGRLGDDTFQTLLAEQRSKLIAAIGVDGYDYLPELLEA